MSRFRNISFVDILLNLIIRISVDLGFSSPPVTLEHSGQDMESRSWTVEGTLGGSHIGGGKFSGTRSKQTQQGIKATETNVRMTTECTLIWIIIL